jgi:uncharacterized protein
VKPAVRHAISLLALVLLVAGCSTDDKSAQRGWIEDEVTFAAADGLTIHSTYRHEQGADEPAALLISESGNTDRNGDNAVAGPVGNMRQLAELLSQHGTASLRYDKVGTGKTGLGPYLTKTKEVGSAVYTTGATAALKFLAEQAGVDTNRLSVYAVGEGAIHAMTLAGDTRPGAPKVHSLALLQPLSGRYLDIVTGRVRAGGNPDTLKTWLAAVEQARTSGTAPAQLPEGLGALLNPGNVKAVVEADAIDPLALAAKVPAGTPVLLSCSDSDGQAKCDAERPLIDALKHTALTVVELKGVNHVLRDDPTDNVANYANGGPLSPQLVTALDGFVAK